MTITPFRQAIRPKQSGLDVLAVKRTMKRMGAQDSAMLNLNRYAGAAFVHVLKAMQHNRGLKEDGVYGPTMHSIIAKHFRAYEVYLYKNASIRRAHPHQDPPLPRMWPLSVWRVDNGGFSGEWGLHPALVPQVHAICNVFGLRVTDGYGGHPPHAYFSDHRVGIAVDLAGSYSSMVACTFWADALRGRAFRWVGGPAHDADGVEVGHYNHVHLSWYRSHPTTIFGTSAKFL